MKEDLLIYTTLLNNQVREEDELTPADIAEVAAALSTADALTHDVVYAIIRKYQLSQNPEMTAQEFRPLPFGMRIVKKKLRLDLAQLPPALLCILHTFATKYYKAASE